MVTKAISKTPLICLLALLLLPGCMGPKTLTMGTSISVDGSGQRVISFALDRKAVISIEKESKTKLENELKAKLPADSKVKVTQKDNLVSYSATIPFRNVGEAPNPFRQLLLKDKKVNASLKREDRIFSVSYDLKEELNLKEDALSKTLSKPLNAASDSPRFEYWVRMPGELRETSGTPTTVNKAVWKLKPGKTYKIRVKSLLIRWWLVALTGIALLLAIGLVGTQIINRKAKREKAS